MGSNWKTRPVQFLTWNKLGCIVCIYVMSQIYTTPKPSLPIPSISLSGPLAEYPLSIEVNSCSRFEILERFSITFQQNDQVVIFFPPFITFAMCRFLFSIRKGLFLHSSTMVMCTFIWSFGIVPLQLPPYFILVAPFRLSSSPEGSLAWNPQETEVCNLHVEKGLTVKWRRAVSMIFLC